MRTTPSFACQHPNSANSLHSPVRNPCFPCVHIVYAMCKLASSLRQSGRNPNTPTQIPHVGMCVPFRVYAATPCTDVTADTTAAHLIHNTLQRRVESTMTPTPRSPPPSFPLSISIRCMHANQLVPTLPGPGVAVYQNKLFAVGGKDGSRPLKSVEVLQLQPPLSPSNIPPAAAAAAALTPAPAIPATARSTPTPTPTAPRALCSVAGSTAGSTASTTTATTTAPTPAPRAEWRRLYRESAEMHVPRGGFGWATTAAGRSMCVVQPTHQPTGVYVSREGPGGAVLRPRRFYRVCWPATSACMAMRHR